MAGENDSDRRPPVEETSTDSPMLESPPIRSLSFSEAVRNMTSSYDALKADNQKLNAMYEGEVRKRKKAERLLSRRNECIRVLQKKYEHAMARIDQLEEGRGQISGQFGTHTEHGRVEGGECVEKMHCETSIPQASSSLILHQASSRLYLSSRSPPTDVENIPECRDNEEPLPHRLHSFRTSNNVAEEGMSTEKVEEVMIPRCKTIQPYLKWMRQIVPEDEPDEHSIDSIKLLSRVNCNCGAPLSKEVSECPCPENNAKRYTHFYRNPVFPKVDTASSLPGEIQTVNEILPSLSCIGQQGMPTIFDLVVQMSHVSTQKIMKGMDVDQYLPTHISVWDGSIPPDSIGKDRLLRDLTRKIFDKTVVGNAPKLDAISTQIIDVRLATIRKVEAGEFVILRDVVIVRAYSIGADDGSHSPVWMLQAKDMQVIKAPPQNAQELKAFLAVARRIASAMMAAVGGGEEEEVVMGGEEEDVEMEEGEKENEENTNGDIVEHIVDEVATGGTGKEGEEGENAIGEIMEKMVDEVSNGERGEEEEEEEQNGEDDEEETIGDIVKMMIEEVANGVNVSEEVEEANEEEEEGFIGDIDEQIVQDVVDGETGEDVEEGNEEDEENGVIDEEEGYIGYVVEKNGEEVVYEETIEMVELETEERGEDEDGLQIFFEEDESEESWSSSPVSSCASPSNRRSAKRRITSVKGTEKNALWEPSETAEMKERRRSSLNVSRPINYAHFQKYSDDEAELSLKMPRSNFAVGKDKENEEGVTLNEDEDEDGNSEETGKEDDVVEEGNEVDQEEARNKVLREFVDKIFDEVVEEDVQCVVDQIVEDVFYRKPVSEEQEEIDGDGLNNEDNEEHGRIVENEQEERRPRVSPLPVTSKRRAAKRQRESTAAHKASRKKKPRAEVQVRLPLEERLVFDENQPAIGRTWVDELAEIDYRGVEREATHEERTFSITCKNGWISTEGAEFTSYGTNERIYEDFMKGLASRDVLERVYTWLGWMETCTTNNTISKVDLNTDLRRVKERCCEGCDGELSLFVQVGIQNPIIKGDAIHLLIDASHFREGNEHLSMGVWKRKTEKHRMADWESIMENMNDSMFAVRRATKMLLDWKTVYVVPKEEDCIVVTPYDDDVVTGHAILDHFSLIHTKRRVRPNPAPTNYDANAPAPFNPYDLLFPVRREESDEESD